MSLIAGFHIANFFDHALCDDLELMERVRLHRGLRHFGGIRVRGQYTKTLAATAGLPTPAPGGSEALRLLRQATPLGAARTRRSPAALWLRSRRSVLRSGERLPSCGTVRAPGAGVLEAHAVHLEAELGHPAGLRGSGGRTRARQRPTCHTAKSRAARPSAHSHVGGSGKRGAGVGARKGDWGQVG